MTETKPLRTIDIKPAQNSLIKAGELVDVVEVSPLTLTDRKIYNLLIENAKQDIARPIEHAIDKRHLQLSRRGNERIDDSIMRLMGAIAQIKTIRNGEPATIRVQLLGRNIEHDRSDGSFYYTFDPVLREVFENSNVFARLKIDVMLSFDGKYGLALYEMIAKRINMRKSEEKFSIQEFRNLLGVPKGKLTSWHNFKSRALEAALEEVNQLSHDFQVDITGIKTGRSYTHLLVKWWRTAPDGEDAALKEQLYSKVGRKARRTGSVEDITFEQNRLSSLLTPNALENGRNALLAGDNHIDLQSAIQRWEEVFADHPIPDNPSGAFVNFCKTIA